MANVDIGPADNIQMELTSGSAIVEAWLPGLVLQSRLNTHHIYTDVSVALFFPQSGCVFIVAAFDLSTLAFHGHGLK